jgi:hypothetical protein
MMLLLGLISLLIGANLASQPIQQNPIGSKLKIEWGTYDTVVMNDQTIMWWVKYSNGQDTGRVHIGKHAIDSIKQTATELWIKESDTSYKIGTCTIMPDFILSPHSSFFMFCGTGINNSLRHVSTPSFQARLILRVGSQWLNQDSMRSVRVVTPDNSSLETFFRKMDSFNTWTQPGKMIMFPARGAEYKLVGWENRYSQCKLLTRSLDSLERGGASKSILFARAKRRLYGEFCTDHDVVEVGDNSTPNWPIFRELAKCAAEGYSHNIPSNKSCQGEPESKHNLIVKQLAKLDEQLPAAGHYHRFRSGSSGVFR